jgi:hypothetical protein
MDRTTASYYRSILFNDAESQESLPVSLVKMHIFAHKRCQAFGMSAISKTVALEVVLWWMASTGEGRKFAQRHPDLKGLFDVTADDESDDDELEAKSPATGTACLVTIDGVEVEGSFVRYTGRGWAKAVVNGEEKNVRRGSVRFPNDAPV